mgnify:CR=1 FL=1
MLHSYTILTFVVLFIYVRYLFIDNNTCQASDIPLTPAMRGIYPNLHAPKGTKRIGETNQTVWKSRERVGGRGRKAVGILPFPPPTTIATSLETGEKGNAAFSFSPGTYFAADGNRFKPVWMYIQKDKLNFRERAAIMMQSSVPDLIMVWRETLLSCYLAFVIYFDIIKLR